jgi:hypothetical protein
LGAVVVLRAAESSERSGVAHFRLCLIDPRDIGECDTVSRGLIPACARAAERTEHVLNVPARRTTQNSSARNKIAGLNPSS